MKNRVNMRNRRGAARRGVGFSLFVLLGMSALLGFATQLASPQTAQAAEGEAYNKFRYLTYFDRCLEKYVDADGKSWDGNNKNIQYEDPKELFKKGEIVAVGVDLDGENGVMSCGNIAHKAAFYILGITDTKQQDIWLEKKIWGKSLGENGGPIKVVGYTEENTKGYANDLRKQIAPMIAEVKYTHTKRDTLERMQPLFEQCFKNLRASRDPVRSWEDGSLQYDNRNIFAERQRFDWDEIKLNGTDTFKLKGNGGLGSTTRAEIGDIELGFAPQGHGLTKDFNDRVSDWYPLGNDLSTAFGDVDGIRHHNEMMASCNIFSTKNTYFFGTNSKDTSTHWVIKNNKLQIAEDKNSDGKIDASEVTESKPKDIGGNEGNIASTANGEGSNNYQCIVTPPLSWIACPIITLMVKALGFLENAIITALQVPPLSASGAFTGLHTTWAAFRDLANVFLVLIFLITIFAQVLPFDVDPYMVKKVLPKLIAAAIFIQFSYFFVQVMFDISRILGAGIGSLIKSIPVSDIGGGLFGQELGDATATSTLGLVGALAVGTAGAAAAFTAGTALIVPVLLLLGSGLISVITLFVTLQMRMIVIIILTIVSPLAFLAWILPNTESYFKKWGTTLIKLLLMYPIIVFMVDSANLISKVSYDAVIAMSGGDSGAGGVSDISKIMISLIPIVIYFMIPMTFKWAGGMFASIAGAVQSQGSKWSKQARSGSLMKNSLENLRQKTGEKLADTQKYSLGNLKNPKSYGKGMSRLGARVATGNAFSFGATGERKLAQTANAAKHARLEAQAATVKELNASNAVIGEMISAKLDGKDSYEYTDRAGHTRTVKLTDDLIPGGMRYLNDNSGQLELAKLGNGTMKYKGGSGKKIDSKGDTYDAADAIYNATTGTYETINGFATGEIVKEATDANAAALLKAAPHMVHGSGAAVYEQATADMISGMKGPAMEVAAEVISGDSSGKAQARLVDSLVGIMNSSDKAGRIDKATAEHIKTLVKGDDVVGSQMIDLNGDGHKVRLDTVIDKIITDSGTVLFNDAARRG